MDEETGIRHLVQGGQRTNEGRNSAIFKYDSQQEVLRAVRVNYQLKLLHHWSGKIYPKRHHEGVQDNDKQEFEEVCSVLSETRHPISAIMPDQ